MEKNGIEKLIGKLRLGDEAAFHSLFTQFYSSLCSFALKYIDDRDAAEDIVQECFLKYWAKREDFDNPYKLKSFLYLVVRNSCLNYIRDNRKQAGTVPDEDRLISEEFLIELTVEEEAYRILYQAIEGLPPQMKAVIYHALDGLKNSEIAEKMQISEHAVHASKKKAYKKLRENLKDNILLIEIISFIFLS